MCGCSRAPGKRAQAWARPEHIIPTAYCSEGLTIVHKRTSVRAFRFCTASQNSPASHSARLRLHGIRDSRLCRPLHGLRSRTPSERVPVQALWWFVSSLAIHVREQASYVPLSISTGARHGPARPDDNVSAAMAQRLCAALVDGKTCVGSECSPTPPESLSAGSRLPALLQLPEVLCTR